MALHKKSVLHKNCIKSDKLRLISDIMPQKPDETKLRKVLENVRDFGDPQYAAVGVSEDELHDLRRVLFARGLLEDHVTRHSNVRITKAGLAYIKPKNIWKENGLDEDFVSHFDLEIMK